MTEPVERPKLVKSKKKKKTNFDKALNMIARVPLTDGLFASEQIDNDVKPVLEKDEMVITESDLTNPDINFNKALKFISDNKEGVSLSPDIDYSDQLKLTEDEKFIRALDLSNIKSEKEYRDFRNDLKIYLRALELLSQQIDKEDLKSVNIEALKTKLNGLLNNLPETITNKTTKEISDIKVDFTSDEEKILNLLTESDIDLNRIRILVKTGVSELNKIVGMIETVQEFNDVVPTTFEEFTNVINKGWSKLYRSYPTESVRLAQYADNEQGKGEKFIEFLFSNATTNGGSVSHDVDIHTNNGNYQFEVKCYASKDSVIRLGMEGSMNRFKGIRILTNIYNSINDFLNLKDKELDIFKAMISNALAIKINEKSGRKYKVKEGMTISEAFNGLKEFFVSSYKGNKDKEDTNEQSSYSDRLNSGELNKTDFENIDNVINVFDIVCNSIIDNSFNYVKILKTNKVYVIVSDNNGQIITSSREGDKGYINIKCYEETKDEWEKQNGKVKSVVLKMRDCISEGKAFTFGTDDININDDETTGNINFYESLMGKSSEELSETIKNHPIILINSKTTDMFQVPSAGNFCLGIYDRVKVNTISQNRFKITLEDSTSNKTFETNISK